MGIWDAISDWLDFGATLGDGTEIWGGDGDELLHGTDNGERIFGGGGNDWVKANGGNDVIFGQTGDDLIEGGSGNDYMDGGDGTDTISYFNATHGVIANLEFGEASTLGAGPEDTDTYINIENLTGSFYQDHLQGSELANRIDGVAGNDAILGWGGDDMLIGGFGNNSIAGGEGNDTVSGGFDNDTLFGNNGADTLDYSYAYEGMYINLASGESRTLNYSTTVDKDSFSGFENVLGSQYNDLIEGNNVRNVIDGSTGIDTVSYRSSGNAVGLSLAAGWGQYGDAFQDTYSNIENIVGSEHASGDSLTGNDIANVIQGLGGNDTIYGLGGDDTLIGGDGSDFIDGGLGNDTVSGAEGANKLDGGDGYDTLDLNPSSGGIGAFGPGAIVDLVAGTLNGLGADGSTVKNFEVLRGTLFEDSLSGDDNANVFYGSGNNDTLVGRGGNDWLQGDTGQDIISGGVGADVIYGGESRDALTGGGSGDLFIYSSILDSGSAGAARDVIRDFATGRDTLVFKGFDGNALVDGQQHLAFIGAAAFSGVAGELRAASNGVNTLVSADVNGDTITDFEIVLNGNLALTAGDFIL